MHGNTIYILCNFLAAEYETGMLSTSSGYECKDRLMDFLKTLMDDNYQTKISNFELMISMMHGKKVRITNLSGIGSKLISAFFISYQH